MFTMSELSESNGAQEFTLIVFILSVVEVSEGEEFRFEHFTF